MTAGVEVDRPLNPTVAPDRVIGHVTLMVACLLLKVFQSAEARQPACRVEAIWQPTEPAEPICVNEPVRGEVAESVDVATLAIVFTPVE